MDFHNIYEKTLNELPWELLADVFVKKLEAKDVKVTKKQKKAISIELQKGNYEKLPIKNWRWWDKRDITINLTEEDLDNILSRLEKFNSELPERTIKMVEEIAPNVSEALLKNMDKATKDERKSITKFREHIWKTWEESFSLLHLLIDIASRAGENAIAISNMDDEEPSNLKSVILRLQARGVQVAREILALMEAGFADGATARWRTLHEITVISLFISDHGEECAIRYIEHDSIAIYKGTKTYQEYCENLGYEPIPSDEYAEIKKAYEECITKYGEEYDKDYGWAAPYLKGRCNFREIENAIEINNLRPFYKYACQTVHAGPRGIFHKVGLMNEDIILFNASDYGFAEVGRNTAMSLTLLSAQLLTHCLVLDMIISGFVMNIIASKTSNSFYATQENIEQSVDTEINDTR